MLNSIPTPKRLPGLIDSKRLLTMLFGGDTECKSRKLAIPTSECIIVASYHDNCGGLQRLVTCDLAFANSAGAALSAIPPVVANNATKAGRLADNVIENLSEVMNIIANLLVESFGTRLELATVSLPNDLTPKMLIALTSDHRVKIDVTIARYDLGRLDLIAI